LHWDQSNSFWLVLADQFEKRGISSRRVRKTALDIIDGGKDAAMMQALGMKPADIRLRARTAHPPHRSAEILATAQNAQRTSALRLPTMRRLCVSDTRRRANQPLYPYEAFRPRGMAFGRLRTDAESICTVFRTALSARGLGQRRARVPSAIPPRLLQYFSPPGQSAPSR